MLQSEFRGKFEHDIDVSQIGISIKKTNFVSLLGYEDGKVYRGAGFANAAFAATNCYYFSFCIQGTDSQKSSFCENTLFLAMLTLISLILAPSLSVRFS